jgi:hypothetical protein
MDGDSHWANQAALILAGLALLVALSGRIWVGPSNPTGPQAGQAHLRADKAQLQATLEQLRKGIRPQFRVPGKPVLPMVPSAPSPKLLPAAPLLPGGPATLVIPPG